MVEIGAGSSEGSLNWVLLDSRFSPDSGIAVGSFSNRAFRQFAGAWVGMDSEAAGRGHVEWAVVAGVALAAWEAVVSSPWH